MLIVWLLGGSLVALACGGDDTAGITSAGGGAGAGASSGAAGTGAGAAGKAGGQAGSSAGGKAGSATAGGSSAAGTSAGTSAAGTSAGGTAGGGTASGGAAGTTTAGAGGTLIGMGGADGCGTTQCTNCLDDDGDGLADGFDPDCTGYLDNDEASFATGIPGDNVDACKQDCFFDGNSGQGDDKCEWNLACDDKNPGKNLGCPYDPNEKKCPTEQSAACVKNCFALVPNGCDCLGCCAFQTPNGPQNALLLPGCSYADIGDPVKCPPCTQQPSCLNSCEPCEYCLGKTELPPSCSTGSGGQAGAGGSGGAAGSNTGGTSSGGTNAGGSSAGGTTAGGSGGTGVVPLPLPICNVGQTACTPTKPCPFGDYCLTGCCVPIVK